MIEWIRRRRVLLFVLIFLGALVVIVELWRFRREHSQDGVILSAGAHYGLDPALIKAVVWREAGLTPRPAGRAGRSG